MEAIRRPRWTRPPICADLGAPRGPREATLGESVWDWIWQPAEGINYIQMYGRLAWINMQLLDLL